MQETGKKLIVKIKEKSQIIYTFFIILFIFFSFVFIFTNYILSSKEEDKFINTTMGATHDIFTEYASMHIDEPDTLTEQIKSISRGNQTILEFQVILFREDDAVVISALKEESIEKKESKEILYDLVSSSDQSFTYESVLHGQKTYKTVQAIKDSDGQIIGAVRTEQALFQVENIISKNIQISILVFIVFIFLLMLLFSRYVKIAEYPFLYDKMKKTNEMKDEFISMASHEIRTPLTAIRGYADMLKEYKVNKEQEEFLNNIDFQTKRLDNLVEDLLDISKIEQDRMDLEVEVFDPKEEIKEVIKFLEYNAKQKNLNLFSEIKQSENINVDRDRLRQVLINLVGNSIKYTNEGEVKIVSLVEDKNLIIKIVDTGIGMDEEQQKGLFQKFYRVKSSETEDIMGTGLGLWITQKLVQMMNGSIFVKSEKGKGTEVSVCFPLV